MLTFFYRTISFGICYGRNMVSLCIYYKICFINVSGINLSLSANIYFLLAIEISSIICSDIAQEFMRVIQCDKITQLFFQWWDHQIVFNPTCIYSKNNGNKNAWYY